MNYQRQTAPYACCQLVALFNAKAFYRQEAPEQHGKIFELLVDACGCRYGSATTIEPALRFLDLKRTDIKPVTLDAILSHVQGGRPVSISVRLPYWGFHEVLIVGIEDGCFQVANWGKYEALSSVHFNELMEACPPPDNQNRCAYAITTAQSKK
jgi:hypothetical protein